VEGGTYRLDYSRSDLQFPAAVQEVLLSLRLGVAEPKGETPRLLLAIICAASAAERRGPPPAYTLGVVGCHVVRVCVD